MKFNSREMAIAASLPNPDKEGKLAYKKPQKATGFKDKWFRLKGNLLFYYSWDVISTGSTFDFSSPQGVIVLERIRVQHEPHHPEQSFVFSISFEPQEGSDSSHMGSHDYASVAKAKHYFAGRTLEDCEDWVQAFRQSSTETLKSQILVLQAKILKLTGVDPLDAFYLNRKVDFSNTGGGLKLHHIVDILNPPPRQQQQQQQQQPHQLDSSRDDDDDDADDDGSKTLTSKFATLTPENGAGGESGGADQGGGGGGGNNNVVVPVIVVQVDDDDVDDSSAPQKSDSRDRQPCRPSVIAESQRLSVDDAASDSSSSSSSSSANGSPTFSSLSDGGVPSKAIRAAAKAEKREKMPTTKKSPRASSLIGAAAAVEERLAKMAVREEEEEEEEVGQDGVENETKVPQIAANGVKVKDDDARGDVLAKGVAGRRNAETKEDGVEAEVRSSSPRAPPRLRTRSRRSNSMKMQLSLIEEEEKARSSSLPTEAAAHVGEDVIQNGSQKGAFRPGNAPSHDAAEDPLAIKKKPLDLGDDAAGARPSSSDVEPAAAADPHPRVVVLPSPISSLPSKPPAFVASSSKLARSATDPDQNSASDVTGELAPPDAEAIVDGIHVYGNDAGDGVPGERIEDVPRASMDGKENDCGKSRDVVSNDTDAGLHRGEDGSTPGASIGAICVDDNLSKAPMGRAHLNPVEYSRDAAAASSEALSNGCSIEKENLLPLDNNRIEARNRENVTTTPTAANVAAPSTVAAAPTPTPSSNVDVPAGSGPKPKPRLPKASPTPRPLSSSGSMKLSALLPPSRPKRKSILARTKSSPSAPKSSFKSFLYDGEESDHGTPPIQTESNV